MKIEILARTVADVAVDMLILPCFVGEKHVASAIREVDGALEGYLAKELKETGFTGKSGELRIVVTFGKLKAKRVAVLGLGEEKKFSLEAARRAAASITQKATADRQRTLAIVLPPSQKMQPRAEAQAWVEGALLGTYQYDKYHAENFKKREEHGIQSLAILEDRAPIRRALAEGVALAELAARGAMLARDLVNEPASVATPRHLADVAERIAKEETSISLEIIDREEAEKRGMGAFLSVAAGSEEPPYFLHLAFKPKNPKKRVAIIGKGITFDSGGLQIKPDNAMVTMKCDMSGAAAVLGLFSVIAHTGIKHEVHGIIAATENMPGRRAYKPGDIVRAMNGKTIEIGHTDAEGRVTMADALSYAVALEPDHIVDLATLTGACMVALGEEIAALMTNDAKLGTRLKTAADETGERIWELPLVEEYASLVKSDVADVKNVSSTRYGGAITAGLFLEQFVEKISWAHLDIAGPAYAERDMSPYMRKGATGYGVRLLLAFLKGLA